MGEMGENGGVEGNTQGGHNGGEGRTHVSAASFIHVIVVSP